MSDGGSDSEEFEQREASPAESRDFIGTDRSRIDFIRRLRREEVELFLSETLFRGALFLIKMCDDGIAQFV